MGAEQIHSSWRVGELSKHFIVVENKFFVKQHSNSNYCITLLKLKWQIIFNLLSLEKIFQR